jgi:hypothetical protein
VVTQDYNQFWDYIESVQHLYTKTINKVQGIALIDDTRYFYASDPEKLYGLEIGTEYILFGNYRDNKCFQHGVMSRFKKIDHA